MKASKPQWLIVLFCEMRTFNEFIIIHKSVAKLFWHERHIIFKTGGDLGTWNTSDVFSVGSFVWKFKMLSIFEGKLGKMAQQNMYRNQL